MNPRLNIPAPPVAATYPGATAADAVTSADIQWRAMFGDARLQRLIEIALSENRDLRVATLQAQEARAQFRIARAAILPTGEIQGIYQH